MTASGSSAGRWRWAPAGLVAVTFGWITTEAGRQPFTVYGLVRTAESASPIAAPALLTSVVLFVTVYFVVFGAGIWYLFRLFGHPPMPQEHGAEDEPPIRTAGITPAPAVDPDRVRDARPQPAERRHPGEKDGPPVPAGAAE